MVWDKGTDWESTVVVSWNVRVLNQPAKRSRVFSQLNKLKAEVVYLQETNLDQASSAEEDLHRCFILISVTKVGQGVVILNCNVLFEEYNVIKDKNGRYIIVQGKLFKKPVVLENMYTPNWDNIGFFHFYQTWIHMI